MRSLFVHLLRRIAPALVLALCLVSAMPGSASAQSASDYFSFSYDIEFSESQVSGSNSFVATIEGQATCTQDFPLSASQASVTGRIVAVHQGTGARVTLCSSYTLTIDPFPGSMGETTQTQVAVPLQFPDGSTSGTYSVIAELVEAKVKVLLVWVDVTGYLPSSKVASTISYSASGGGGGGGSFTSKKVSVSGLNSNNFLLVNASGVVEESVRLFCNDADVYIHIDEGTKILDKNGYVISSLTSGAVEEPPGPAPGTAIALAVDFGPDGATFSPAITLVMDYDPESLPEGVLEEELYIAYWDGSEWQALPSVLDMDAGTISAQVSHFTEFAVTGSIPAEEAPDGETTEEPAPETAAEPPVFSISALSVTPDEAAPDQTVTVYATVANTGGSRGKYAVVLKMNGVVESEKQLILDAGVEYKVSFEITPASTGTYEVDVNGLTGSFTVREEPVEAVETSSETTVETDTSGFAFKIWHIIAGAAAVILLLGGLVTFLVVRARG